MPSAACRGGVAGPQRQVSPLRRFCHATAGCDTLHPRAKSNRHLLEILGSLSLERLEPALEDISLGRRDAVRVKEVLVPSGCTLATRARLARVAVEDDLGDAETLARSSELVGGAARESGVQLRGLVRSRRLAASPSHARRTYFCSRGPTTGRVWYSVCAGRLIAAGWMKFDPGSCAREPLLSLTNTTSSSSSFPSSLCPPHPFSILPFAHPPTAHSHQSRRGAHRQQYTPSQPS